MTDLKTKEEAAELLEEIDKWNPDSKKYQAGLNSSGLTGENAKYNYFYIAISTRVEYHWHCVFTISSREQWNVVKQMFVDKRQQEEDNERLAQLEEQAEKELAKVEVLVNYAESEERYNDNLPIV